MTPIDPVELSALLDGELSPEREGEVRRAIATDPVLREEFDRLSALHTACKAGADAAAFSPAVSLAPSPFRERLAAVAVVIGLLLLRLVLKVSPPPLAIALELATLAIIASVGVRQVLRASEEDKRLTLRA